MSKTLTVGELLDLLDGMPEDTPVMLAHQPNYPLQFTVLDAVLVGPAECYLDRDGEEYWCDTHSWSGPMDDLKGPSRCPDHDDEEGGAVYIVEGSQPSSAPYLPGHVSRELGWR